MPYTWVNGDVITSTRLNAIEQDRAPVTVQSITGLPNGVLASHPIPRLRMANANIGDFVYLFGGYDGNLVTTTNAYRYSISGNSYTAIAPLATSTEYHAVAVGADVYLMRNDTTAQTLRYNVSANTYTTLTAYSAANVRGMVSIGTDIYFTQSATALVQYSTVGNSYTTLAAIPVGSYYVMATDGTDIYLFGRNNSYKYIVASNSYTAIAALGNSAYLSYSILTSKQGYVYIPNSGSTRNKNSIYFSWTQDLGGGIAYAGFIGRYDITANTMTSAVDNFPASGDRGSVCGISASESMILFHYNTSTQTPRNTNDVLLFTSYLSPFTATGPGIITGYQTVTLRNETTAMTGQNLAFKTGDVITNSAARGGVLGGTAIAAIDAIVIQKG